MFIKDWGGLFRGPPSAWLNGDGGDLIGKPVFLKVHIVWGDLFGGLTSASLNRDGGDLIKGLVPDKFNRGGDGLFRGPVPSRLSRVSGDLFQEAASVWFNLFREPVLPAFERG